MRSRQNLVCSVDQPNRKRNPKGLSWADTAAPNSPTLSNRWTSRKGFWLNGADFRIRSSRFGSGSLVVERDYWFSPHEQKSVQRVPRQWQERLLNRQNTYYGTKLPTQRRPTSRTCRSAEYGLTQKEQWISVHSKSVTRTIMANGDTDIHRTHVWIITIIYNRYYCRNLFIIIIIIIITKNYYYYYYYVCVERCNLQWLRFVRSRRITILCLRVCRRPVVHGAADGTSFLPCDLRRRPLIKMFRDNSR